MFFVFLFIVIFVGARENDLSEKENDGTTKKKGLACGGCHAIIKFIKEKMIDKSVEEIWLLISEKCPKKAYVNKICRVLDKEVVEKIVENIASSSSVEKICELIKIC